tara:strand:+ start:5173 stop:6213 length:1041 start_codon:yes stop_codon:yes gene_type:complete
MYLKLIRQTAPEACTKILNPSQIFIDRLNNDNEPVSSVMLDQEGSIDDDADYIILVPGGFLGCPDITDPAWQIKWIKNSYIKKALKAISEISKPTLVHGVEIGPFLRPLVAKTIRIFLKGSFINKVYSRNHGGANYAKKHLHINPTVLPDFVSSVTQFYPEDSLEVNTNELGIHATGKIFSNNILARNFLSDIETCISKANIKSVMIFSDQLIPSTHKSSISKLCARLTEKGVKCTIKDYEGILPTLKNIQSCSTIITSKLHVGVCGLSYSKKVVSISSHPKLSRFYSDSGLSSFNTNYFFSNRKSKIDLMSRILKMNNSQYFNSYKNNSLEVYSIYRSSLVDFLE